MLEQYYTVSIKILPNHPLMFAEMCNAANLLLIVTFQETYTVRINILEVPIN